MRTALAISVGCLAMVVASGCVEGPRFVGADGALLDLRRFECVSLTSVEVDPNLGMSGLPGQLTPVLQGELLQSERWAYRGPAPTVMVVSGHHMQNQRPVFTAASTSQPTGEPAVSSESCSSVALSVTITDMEIPTKLELRFGKPRTMKCRVDVCDSQTSAHLGSADIMARSGPTRGQRLAAQGFAGSAASAGMIDDETDKSAALSATAKAIVEALDASKTASKTAR